jgi:hypothetical protein
MQIKEHRDQMFERINSWKVSGLSQKAFCRQEHISYHIFHYWYKVYRNVNALPNAPFVKLQVTAPFGTSSVELICGDGKRLVFHQLVSVDYLKALIS